MSADNTPQRTFVRPDLQPAHRVFSFPVARELSQFSTEMRFSSENAIVRLAMNHYSQVTTSDG